jgi:hypothetical protein
LPGVRRERYAGSVRRLGVVLIALVAGCSFDGGTATRDGADDGGGSDADATTDATMAAADASGLCGGRVWFTDFSADPTQQDLNGDAVKDWGIRGDAAFPANELTGTGTWQTLDAGPPLDTLPRQPFATRTIVDVRMRNTTTCCARGAVFWINFGFDGTGFAAMFVDVKKTSSTAQAVKLVRRTAMGMDDQFALISGLPTDFVDVHLEIDPAASMVQYAVAGSSGGTSVERQVTADTDGWATVVAFSGAAEFDEVRVEVCPGIASPPPP